MSVQFKASTYIPTTLKVVVTGTQRALTGFLIVSMSAIWTNVAAMAATGFGPWMLGGNRNWVEADTLKEIAEVSGGQSFIAPPIDKDNGAGIASALASISDIVGSGYASARRCH